jgi:hypothetical protein
LIVKIRPYGEVKPVYLNIPLPPTNDDITTEAKLGLPEGLRGFWWQGRVMVDYHNRITCATPPDPSTPLCSNREIRGGG